MAVCNANFRPKTENFAFSTTVTTQQAKIFLTPQSWQFGQIAKMPISGQKRKILGFRRRLQTQHAKIFLTSESLLQYPLSSYATAETEICTHCSIIFPTSDGQITFTEGAITFRCVIRFDSLNRRDARRDRKPPKTPESAKRFFRYRLCNCVMASAIL